MSGETTNNRALGISFLTLGIAMAVSFGLTLGPALIGLGAPFFVLGIIFMGRKQAGATAEGDE